MKKRFTNWALLIGILLIVASVVLIIWFFLKGEVTVTGSYPKPETSDSITCIGADIPYPYFRTDGVSKTIINVTGVFEDDKLSTISLIYSIYYSNPNDVNRNIAVNQANINLATQADGLGSNIFNIHFSEFSDHIDARFYAEAKDITARSSKYLMLNSALEHDTYSKSLVEKIYTKQGLDCIVKNQ